jgi:hypothetical protein
MSGVTIQIRDDWKFHIRFDHEKVNDLVIELPKDPRARIRAMVSHESFSLHSSRIA